MLLLSESGHKLWISNSTICVFRFFDDNIEQVFRREIQHPLQSLFSLSFYCSFFHAVVGVVVDDVDVYVVVACVVFDWVYFLLSSFSVSTQTERETERETEEERSCELDTKGQRMITNYGIKKSSTVLGTSVPR